MAATATMTEAAVHDATRIMYVLFPLPCDICVADFTFSFSTEGTIDLNSVGEVEARKIMSLEHKALGYRPPPGSLASEAQAAAAKHPQGGPNPPPTEALKKAALSDAARIENERGHPIPKTTVVDGIDLQKITEGW